MRHLLLGLLLAQIVSAQNTDPFPTPPNQKGLQVQMVNDALALGIHHAGINVNITALYSPKSKPAAGEFVWNEGYLASLDAQIKPLSDAGIVVYLIVIAYPSKNPAIDAVVLHPGHRKDYKFTVGAVNTTNGFFDAVISKLAERWSGAHPEHGRVWGWIIGNEVNSHFLWNNMGLVPLETAASEYEKAFRIAHTAIRRHSQTLAKCPQLPLLRPSLERQHAQRQPAGIHTRPRLPRHLRTAGARARRLRLERRLAPLPRKPRQSTRLGGPDRHA